MYSVLFRPIHKHGYGLHGTLEDIKGLNDLIQDEKVLKALDHLENIFSYYLQRREKNECDCRRNS